MHSGDQLFGSVCKCMDCARKRYARIEDEMRLRHRSDYNELRERMDEANAAVTAAQAVQSEARAALNRLHDATRQELKAEYDRL